MDDADAFSKLYRGEAESVLIFLTRRTFDVETAVELTAETFAIALLYVGQAAGAGARAAAGLTVHGRQAPGCALCAPRKS
jgi:hypothetical protein